MKKRIALSLALTMLLGFTACGQPPESSVPPAPVPVSQTPSPSPEPEPEPEPSILEEPSEIEPEEPLVGPTIESVTYGPGYIETAATDDDTINSPSASSNITSVTLSDGTVIEAENGGVLTLVVDGDQYDILDYLESGKILGEGTFSFETTAGTESGSEMGKFMNMAGQTAQYTYRSALRVLDGGIVETETIPALLTKVDSYDGTGVRGGELNSYGPFFNGIHVSGDQTASKFTI